MLLVAASASALVSGGCASNSAADRETAAQLQALAARQAVLERKLELLETRVDANAVVKGLSAEEKAAGQGGRKSSQKPAPRAEGRVPSNLATVKLAPDGEFADAAFTEDALAPILAGNSKAPPEEQFDAVLAALASGEQARGADAANTLADRYPMHPRAPEVLLAAGLALMANGDVPVALWTLQRVSDDYPRSPQAPDALVNRALGQVKLERTGEARTLFSAVIDRYPHTSAAGRARAELKNIPAGDSAPAAQ